MAHTTRAIPATLWRCVGMLPNGAACTQVLGEVAGASVTIAHQRRRIMASLPCSQICDKCGTINFWPPREDGQRVA